MFRLNGVESQEIRQIAQHPQRLQELRVVRADDRDSGAHSYLTSAMLMRNDEPGGAVPDRRSAPSGNEHETPMTSLPSIGIDEEADDLDDLDVLPAAGPSLIVRVGVEDRYRQPAADCWQLFAAVATVVNSRAGPSPSGSSHLASGSCAIKSLDTLLRSGRSCRQVRSGSIVGRRQVIVGIVATRRWLLDSSRHRSQSGLMTTG